MKNTDTISYFVYENEMFRQERNIKRLIVALIVSVSLIFATNAVWLYWWCQYDYVATETVETETYKQDGCGNNIIGSMNEVRNESKLYTNKNNQNSGKKKEER